MARVPAPDFRTLTLRTAAISFVVLAAGAAAALLAAASTEDGVHLWDVVRTTLIFVTTAWLAWGAAGAFVGLPNRRRGVVPPPLTLPQPPTVVLVPICNEDPVTTFARIAAMDGSIRAAGLNVDIAILSDTRDDLAAARERDAFARLLAETGGAGRLFYRRRMDNRGRKAGNIEDFIRTSGGAYRFAVILDADSLMEGETIRHLIARMQADPKLGLLQTLPKIIGARSLFGRAMQFSAAFHAPVFARGLARMQGATGPFWGHNAIIRVKAFAESCGLPALNGQPPFGGHILSHDYVEAALLARAGWKVELDETIEGSFEEGPDNILAHARRDRRWCQGNLQHARLLAAPGLAPWSRFVFVQGIFAYVASLFWGAFLIASIAAAVTAPPPNYFPEPYQLFPVFPSDRTKEIVTLALGIVGLLLLPKLSILGAAALSDRTRGFGGKARAAGSVLAEIVLSSLLAPVMLMYQSRAVMQVLAGRDGGWPANQRGEGRLGPGQSLVAGFWIFAGGAIALAAVKMLAPSLAIWLLPICLPMLAAPFLIWASSHPIARGLFTTPEETDPSPVIRSFHRWQASLSQPAAQPKEALDAAA
ncbi:glucans biosynthesis glucosyltransferase MdoH [Rhodovulum tesquicola]|uniref:glucans biosynthesis glucosyltransferase MdoH n=1 Tax=Rhodovulum tesquicola TaxID=540254 RepID=UPI002096DA49|nr:glucans biosynthesis glucosyltransferase MdoH [Rhodovulum tesquicola]MCO8144569.1 glucans biosynthesis glucosyltransferase MdoH [Rhodovulum tesquicola]